MTTAAHRLTTHRFPDGQLYQGGSTSDIRSGCGFTTCRFDPTKGQIHGPHVKQATTPDHPQRYPPHPEPTPNARAGHPHQEMPRVKRPN
jgi:hypothetical protein